MITREELSRLANSGKSYTAKEWRDICMTCPEWVEEQQAKEAEKKAVEARSIEEQAPLLADLRAVGCTVRWIWDLVNSAEGYPAALPVLIDHLRRPYSDGTLEGIVRALSVKEARGLAGSAIVEKLSEAGHGQQLRWALANALTVVADQTSRSGIKTLIAGESSKDIAERLTRSLKTAAKP